MGQPAARGGLQEPLIEALEARRGLVCFVGAGGKKTAMRRLAEAHGGRVAVTSTVKILPFDSPAIGDWVVGGATTLDQSVPAAALSSRAVAYCGPESGAPRHAGVPATLVERLHREIGFDVTYVKADGARMRQIKAQGDDELPLLSRATTVVDLCSVRAVGRPLDDRVAHHPERVAAMCGASAGEAITPVHLARLLARNHQRLESYCSGIVSVINMADDPDLIDTAKRAARLALEENRALTKVVVTCLTAEHPLIAVITP